MISICIRLVLTITAGFALAGCIESSFVMAPGARLPRWFDVPDGATRNELKVTMDYHTNGNAVFKLFIRGERFPIKQATGVTYSSRPLRLNKTPAGFPKNYPLYEIITVNGITDIVEHRKMEPIFYTVDDPATWNELGVQNKY